MQAIHIKNQQGGKLAASLFMPIAEPRWILIVSHGFRGGKENGGRIFNFAKRINELGGIVFAFDFSGSGQSDGDLTNLTLSRQVNDLQSVIDYADHYYQLPIALLGRSFGGSTVIAAGAGDERISAFVLWSTPIFVEETFVALMPTAYKSMLAGDVVHIQDEAGDYELGPDFAADLARHDMDKHLQAIGNRPVLIIQAQDDEVVALENAQYMQSQLKNVTLHLIAEAGHRFLEKITLRENVTIDWLKKWFAF